LRAFSSLCGVIVGGDVDAINHTATTNPSCLHGKQTPLVYMAKGIFSFSPSCARMDTTHQGLSPLLEQFVYL
jgi:hypothetical protein